MNVEEWETLRDPLLMLEWAPRGGQSMYLGFSYQTNENKAAQTLRNTMLLYVNLFFPVCMVFSHIPITN